MLAVILVSDLFFIFNFRNKRLAVTLGTVIYIYNYSVALTITFKILKLNLGSILKRNPQLEAFKKKLTSSSKRSIFRDLF